MLVIDKLQTVTLTPVEQAVAQYIYDHRHEIAQHSTRSIAKAVYCSSSAVIRVANKLGFDGYNTMKQQIMQEQAYLDAHFEDIDPNIPFQRGDPIMNVAHAIKRLRDEASNDTLSLLRHDALQHAVKLIDQAEHIYVFAFSAHLSLAEVFQMKMSRIHKPVILCSHIGEENYYAGIVKKEDLGIVISYSGETRKLVKTASLLKEKGTPVLVVTSIGENTLSQLGDEVLYMATREKLFSKIANYTSEQSLALLLDILYSCYFQLDYDAHLKEKVSYAKKVELNHYSTNKIISE